MEEVTKLGQANEARHVARRKLSPDGSPYLHAESYPLHTAQEWDALAQAAADGKSGRNYINDPQAGTRVHQGVILPKGRKMAHRTVLALTPSDRDAGATLIDLERLTARQDADCIFALLYVSSVLAMALPMRPGSYAGGWISLDDVIEMVGWDPRSSKERAEMRAQVWDYLCFGARVTLTGQRTGGPYVDPRTGEVIDTYVESPLWSFLRQERQVQPSLLPEYDVPLFVEVVASKEWERLMTNPATAQYLPLGDMLRQIPSGQPSGAYARVIGFALASFWRRHPRETLDETLQPTRGELLKHYTPRRRPLEDILCGPNPIRAIDYWHVALQSLVHVDFLARKGEAELSLEEMKKNLSRYNWQTDWVRGEVLLLPGPLMLEHVQVRADSLPPLGPPQALPQARKRK